MAAGIFLHDADTFLECRLLIAHPARPRILTVRRADAWALPALTPLEQHPAMVTHINAAVFRLFSLKTFVRRLVSERPGDSGYPAIHRLYELEVTSELARQRIERTAWAGKIVLGEMVFEQDFDKRSIESWVDENDTEIPVKYSDPGRPLWSRPGWYEAASSWMRRQTSGRDSTGNATPDQHWTDEHMTVLSAPSSDGIVVMTAEDTDSPQDPSEWAARHGWQRPELITNDSARRWSLYRTRDRATDLDVAMSS